MLKQIITILFSSIFVSLLGQNSSQLNIKFLTKLYTSPIEKFKETCINKGLEAITEVDFCLPNDYFPNPMTGDSYCISDERTSKDTVIDIMFPVSNNGREIKYIKNPYFEKLLNELKIRKISNTRYWSSWLRVEVTKYKLSNQLNIFIFRNADFMEVKITNSKSLDYLKLVDHSNR
jgi:hypothetical protein